MSYHGPIEETTEQGVRLAQVYKDAIAKVSFSEVELKSTGYDFLRSKILRIALDALKKEEDCTISVPLLQFISADCIES